MQALIRRIFFYKLFPICWTILIIFLLCLPGSMVPGTGLFGLEGFDKFAHIILFGGNVLFWGLHFCVAHSRPALRNTYIAITIFTIAFGVIMEFVQMYWIPNRSFDGYDIIADAVGAVAAGILLMRGLTNVN